MTHLWTVLAEAARPGSALHTPFHPVTEHPMPELLDRAERTAGAVLAATGGRPPRRVGILMANGEPWLRAALTGFRLDAAIVPMPLPVALAGPDAYLQRLGRLVAAAGLDTVLVDSSLATLVSRRVAAGLPEVRFVDVTDPGPARGPLPALGGGAAEAVVQFTSGSTSAPKGVVLSHDNVAVGLAAVTEGLGWVAGDAFGLWVPLYHDMGLFSLLSGLALGASACLWQPADFVRTPMAWLRSFAESVATVQPAPNFFYDFMVAAHRPHELAGLDLSSWRLAPNGAEPVQRRTLVAFEETYRPYGLRPGTLNPVYGMAEATLIVSGPDPALPWRSVSVDRDRLDDGEPVRLVADDDPQARPVVSCGRASPGISLRVAAADGTPRPDGAVGEVQLTGPAVTRGYLGLPAAEQPFTADGWLRTGDLGFLHGDELYLVGRLKDIITVRGQNYYAEDVEEIVRGLPAAGRRRVVAIPWDGDGAWEAGDPGDGGGGEQMVVLWETALAPEEAAGTAAALRDEVVRRLGLDAVEVVPVPPKTIPTTSSGKVQRQATRLLHRERRGTADGGGAR